MARAHVSHNLGDLQYDLERGPVDLYQGGGKIVGSAAREGGQTARRIAQWTSGQHAKKYPNSITWDRAPQTYLGFGGGQIKANYGPEYRGQGKLGAILEDGSINNPGHHNLDQSLDVVRPKFHRDISELIGNLFWPGNAS